MVFLNQEQRRALSQRSPREEVECPVCKGKAERQRNGDWTCIASFQQNWGALVMHMLTCGARGVTVNGDLVAIEWPHEDTSLSDAS